MLVRFSGTYDSNVVETFFSHQHRSWSPASLTTGIFFRKINFVKLGGIPTELSSILYTCCNAHAYKLTRQTNKTKLRWAIFHDGGNTAGMRLQHRSILDVFDTTLAVGILLCRVTSAGKVFGNELSNCRGILEISSSDRQAANISNPFLKVGENTRRAWSMLTKQCWPLFKNTMSPSCLAALKGKLVSSTVWIGCCWSY